MVVAAGAEPGADADRIARAEALFEKSEMAFAQGRLDDARVFLERAFALDPVPVLLYNLARVEEAAGQDRAALARYQEYLRRFPRAEYRALVERRVEVLASKLKDRRTRAADVKTYRPPPTPTIVEADPDADEEGGSIAGPVTLLSVGAAGVATGAVLGFLSRARYDDANAASDQQTALRQFGQSQDLGQGANIAYAIGGAAIAAGLLWWLL